MTPASIRRHDAHNDWLVTTDLVVTKFGNLRAATSFMRTCLLQGHKLVMLSLQPRK